MFRSLVLAAASLALAASAPAGNDPTPKSIEELDALLAKQFQADAIPGTAVAIVEDGQISFAKGYGVADKAKATPVTPDTVFRAASISKSFTGIAVMAAVQDGKVALDGRLKDLAPEVKFENPWEEKDPVRLAHLIEHTTGWPDISLRILTMEGKGWSLARGVETASTEFVSRWKPGRFAVYNNAGPAVAGLILEKTTGQDFNAYMRTRVLRPMGIATGDFELTPELAPRLAKSYDLNGRETPFQHIILPPAGSLDVSVKELAQIVRFFLGRGTIDGTQILTPESVSRIERGESTVASAAGFAAYNYGLGNAAFPDKGPQFRGHNGGIDSFTSVYGYSVAANAGYVILANGGNGVDIGRPAAQLIQRYLTRNLKPNSARIVAVDQAKLDTYAGLYRVVTPSNTLTQPYQQILGLRWVSASNGKLTMNGTDFFPTSEHTFRRADREAPTAAFVSDGEGTYRFSAFDASVKEPAWRAVLIVATLALLLVGAVSGLVLLPIWLIALIRGRLADRGGVLVRILPLLAIGAMLTTFALPFSYLGTGAIPDALALVTPGAYSYAIFAFSVAFPLLGALGLWRGVVTGDANLFIRGYAVLTSLAVLLFSLYCATIGWIGAQTWAM